MPQVGIYPWDVCAGAVIVEEAGGVCLDTMGGDFDLASRGSAKLGCLLIDGCYPVSLIFIMSWEILTWEPSLGCFRTTHR